MRFVLFLSLILVFIFTINTQLKAQMRVAAVVNDDIISIFDLEQAVRIAAVAGGAQINLESMERLAPQVLRSLIDDVLKNQAAKAANIQVSDNDIEKAFDNISQQNKMNLQEMGNLLSANGIAFDSMKFRLESRLLWQGYVSQKIRSTIRISDDEIEELLEQQLSQRNQSQYHLQEIFLPMENQNALNILQGMRQEIINGSSFGAFANAFSQSVSAANNGDVGYVYLNQIDASLQKAITPLQIGEISEIASNPHGHYLFKLLDMRQLDENDARAKLDENQLATMRQSIEKRIGNEKVNVLERRLLRDLRRKAFIDIRL